MKQNRGIKRINFENWFEVIMKNERDKDSNAIDGITDGSKMIDWSRYPPSLSLSLSSDRISLVEGRHATVGRKFAIFPFQRGEIATDFVHHAANYRQIGQRIEKTVTFLDESRLVLTREEEKHADSAAPWYVESSCQTTFTSPPPLCPCCFHSSNLSITTPPQLPTPENRSDLSRGRCS